MNGSPRIAPGPLRAHQIREGDPYELSNGHRIDCMTAGGRHGRAHLAGGRVLATDPAIGDQVGIDVGIAFNDDQNLRAPDLVVGAVEPVPGWQRTFPPLAVEYADTGQDEADLQQKIRELLAGGTRLVWVVRLKGPLQVEVHAADAPPRIFGADDELHAPGILRNPVPVRALVDPRAANAATLRNLLQEHGYDSIHDIESRSYNAGTAAGEAVGHVVGHALGQALGLAAGQLDALVDALLTVLAARGLSASDAELARIRACREPERLRQWLARAAVSDSAAAALD